jgi:hypothetical protein
MVFLDSVSFTVSAEILSRIRFEPDAGLVPACALFCAFALSLAQGYQLLAK